MIEPCAVSVTGLVPRSHLGVVLPHEHVFLDLRTWLAPPDERKVLPPQPQLVDRCTLVAHPHCHESNLIRRDIDAAVEEVEYFVRAGGRTIVDCTPSDVLGRHLAGLAAVARRTGAVLIGATGHYIRSSHPAELDETAETQIREQFVHEITVGVDGVRCGFIGEIGIESATPHPTELKVLRAAAAASAVTSAPVSVHVISGLVHAARSAVVELIDVFEGAGGDPASLIICHQDGSEDDVDYQDRLLRRGVTLEFDTFGYAGKARTSAQQYVQFPNDLERARAVADLIDRGWIEQLLISHDISFNTAQRTWGGWGFAHILESLVPVLDSVGVDDGARRQIMETNPARLLAFDTTSAGADLLAS